MHVYRAELMFQGPMQKCMFLCTCSEMSPAWQLIDGVDFSNVTPSSYTPNLCRHAIAIKALHETGQIPFASTSDGNCSSILNDVLFDNASQPITVLSASHGIILSCDSGDGHPCVTVDVRGVVLWTSKIHLHARPAKPPNMHASMSPHLMPGSKPLLARALRSWRGIVPAHPRVLPMLTSLRMMSSRDVDHIYQFSSICSTAP